MFLFDKIAKYDLVVARVIESLGSQMLRAELEHIYSASHGMGNYEIGTEFEFVRSPGHWGDVPLKIGDRAFLFVGFVSGHLYEDAWRGHMVIEKIDGEPHAIFQFKELWLSQDVPSLIRENSRQDPKRPYASAIRFDVIESYLRGLIGNAGNLQRA